MVVSTNATMFLILLAILDLPSVYLLDSGKTQGKGMYLWFKIGSLLTILGQWGRWFCVKAFPNDFWLTIIPSSICALGQPFILNGIPKLAVIWFGDDKRVIAQGI